MKKRRIIIAVVAGVLLIVLCITAYSYRDFINVYLVNRELNVNGIKLLMPGDEAGKIFYEKYDPKVTNIKFLYHHFGRHDRNAGAIKIGRYKHRIVSIYTNVKGDTILGIKRGDAVAYAAAELKKRGFKVESFSEDSTSLEAARGNINILMYTGKYKDVNSVITMSIRIYPDGSEQRLYKKDIEKILNN